MTGVVWFPEFSASLDPSRPIPRQNPHEARFIYLYSLKHFYNYAESSYS